MNWSKIWDFLWTLMIISFFIYAFVFSMTDKYDRATYFLVAAFLNIWLRDRYGNQLSR